MWDKQSVPFIRRAGRFARGKHGRRTLQHPVTVTDQKHAATTATAGAVRQLVCPGVGCDRLFGPSQVQHRHAPAPAELFVLLSAAKPPEQRLACAAFLGRRPVPAAVR